MRSTGRESRGRPRHTELERLAQALEAGRMGTWHWDVRDAVLSCDAALLQVLGTTPERFDGTLDAFLSLVHPDDRELTVAVVRRSLEGRGEHRSEHRVVLPDGTLRWIGGTGRVLLDDDGEPVAMVGVAADITDRKTAEHRLAFLARAGELLGSSLDPDVTLQQLCELAVERLADWCSVDLVDPLHPDGVRQVAVAHRDPSKVAYARSLRTRFGVDRDAPHGLAAVLRTGRPEVIPELQEDFLRPLLQQVPGITADDVEAFLALGLRSSLTVPLTSPGAGVIGALTLVTAETGGRYDEDDVALALEVAGRAATAVEHARLYASAAHAARTLQRSLLPPAMPDVPFADLAAYYAPAGRSEVIGGDFYDVWPTPSGGLCLVVGDVSGKGVDAAALTGECRWTLRSSLTRSGSPAVALDELNESMLLAGRDRFVTVVAAVLEPVDGGVHVSYACGGHPAPLVRRAAGTAELLPGEGQIVGVLPGPVARAGSTLLCDGDAIVLYSDGFSEARDRSGLFGEEGMLEVAQRSTGITSAQALADALVQVVDNLGPQRDDRALVVARVHRTARGAGRGASRAARPLRSELAELVLDEDAADAVPQARGFARAAVGSTVSPDLAADAELVVTELVTNALLHGAAPVVLRLHRDADRGSVHVEVQDAGHRLPARPARAAEGLTGRGLGLVATLAADWGVDAVAGGGKAVWAVLHGSAGEDAAVPQLDVDALLEQPPHDDGTLTVELVDIPTGLLLAAKTHVENLIREFTLVSPAAPEDRPLTPHLAGLVRTVAQDFAEARDQIKRQALAAAERSQPLTHLRLRLPLTAADAGDRYLAALDDVDRYARDARLLTLETPPVHRVFRQWYVRALVQQLRAAGRGEVPPVAPTFTEHLAAEVTELSQSREAAARLTLLQRVTAALTAAGTVQDIAATLVTQATAVLEAAGAAVHALGDDGMLHQVGLASGRPEVAQRYTAFPVSADLPGGVALRSGQPVVLRSRDQLVRRFPALADVYPDQRSLLVAPMTVAGRPWGVFSLSFAQECSVDEQSQIDFLTALAAVTAQALERAVLPAPDRPAAVD